MNNKTFLIFSKQSQPLIRHCWIYHIYKKKPLKISCKEKFVNLLTKNGKKTKAYKLFNKTGVLAKRKIARTEQTNFFFQWHRESIEKIKKKFIENNNIFQKLNDIKKQNPRLSFSKASKTSDKTIRQNLPTKLNPSVTQYKIDKVSKKGNKNQESLIKGCSLIDKKGPPWLLCKASLEVRTPLSFNSLILQAINNIKPNLEVRKVRIAGTTYLVPAIIQKNRQETLAIKWLIACAHSRKRGVRGSFADNLANELIDALMKRGQARQKRDDLHKLAEANRAYIRYRWW